MAADRQGVSDPMLPTVTRPSADVVVCGAGIAGVATAYFLAARRGVSRVVVCDPRPPLTLTSDKSTECYRNFWPNRPMVALMNRSIDLMEELSLDSDNAIGMNRRGYLYVTADRVRLDSFVESAGAASAFGAGPVRVHRGEAGDPEYVPSGPDGWADAPDGADVIADPDLLHGAFPGLAEEAVGALHVRRAGWVSAQQMGALMLERAGDAGVEVVPRAVVAVERRGGRVTGVRLDDGTGVTCGAFVDAAGPMLGRVAGLLGEELPVHSEVHLKVAFRDTLATMPRHAPLMIWADPQRIGWADEERDLLAAEGRHDVLGDMPPACHGRPEGGAGSPWVLALWEYRRLVQEPSWPLPEDPLYAEVVLRGMATMLPAMSAYLDHMPEPVIDGGYYTKTVENRPLAGPLATDGAFVAGAMSGFGVMAACGVGELAALHVTQEELPDHASAFMLQRYDDPGYQEELGALSDTGQI
jgi:sarcosine oxidase, subunit beta